MMMMRPLAWPGSLTHSSNISGQSIVVVIGCKTKNYNFRELDRLKLGYIKVFIMVP